MEAHRDRMGPAGGGGATAAPPPLFRPVPLLLKPPKRPPARALPSALHIGFSSTLSVAVVAAINIGCHYGLGPHVAMARLVQQGTMMAMVTIAVLAMPNLGNSVSKGVQRIAGVMAGGWLFYALYATCQLWWFLSLCLAVWAFVLVALSFFLSGRQFLFPVALVTAFIVATNFNSVQQAFTMTLVKTVAISGAIVIYTVVSMLLFPITATQQAVALLSDTLVALHELAEVVLLTGAGGGEAVVAESGGVNGSGSPGEASKKKGKGSAKPAALPSQGALLAARAANNLQIVQQLLPAARKERYVGHLGSYKCFVPSAKRKGLDESTVMAVVACSNGVLRSLMAMMGEYGNVPLARRPPPAALVHEPAPQLVQPLAEHAVAALKDMSAALPASGPVAGAAPIGRLLEYGDVLQQLVAASGDGGGGGAPVAAVAPAPDSELPAAAAAPTRWRAAAAAAAGAPVGARGAGAEQIAAAFARVLSDAVATDEARLVRWCSTLVLSKQLGRSLAGLAGALDALLPTLPGAPAPTGSGAAAAAAAAPAVPAAAVGEGAA